MRKLLLQSDSVFQSILPDFHESNCVTASSCRGRQIATLQVSRRSDIDLVQVIRRSFGVELLSGSRRSSLGGITFLGIAPRKWLVIQESVNQVLIASLKESIGQSAAVTDQSDGYAILRVAGSKARAVLCKLFPIDLHPESFTQDSVAVTRVADIVATIWRVCNDSAGLAVFEIAIYRSFSADFCHALIQAGAEFGRGSKREDIGDA